MVKRKQHYQKPQVYKKKPIQRTASHPLYGDVPIIEGIGMNASGKEFAYGPYPDPNYKPKLPPGAVPGNVVLQEFCSCHFPHYFYVDTPKTCVQCGKEFIFSGKEQKFWYETLKFNFHSDAIRCASCRKKKRSEKAIANQMEKAYETCRQNPNDSYAKLALAEAVCLYFETFQKGDLEIAIASAREAIRLDKQCIEGLYWEAVAHKLANREKKSKSLFGEFLQKASSILRCKNLLNKVTRILST